MKINLKKDKIYLEDLKNSWIEKAIEACGGEIPVLTRIPQNTDRANFSFVGIQRYHRLAEIIRNIAPERFKTNSDVFRACLASQAKLGWDNFNPKTPATILK